MIEYLIRKEGVLLVLVKTTIFSFVGGSIKVEVGVEQFIGFTTIVGVY